MIARLNLASQPFRNRTLPWTVAVVVSLLSLLALVYVLSEYRRASAETASAERQVQTLRAEREDLKRQAAEIKQNIPEDQQRTLEAAHTLVERKGFSWSQLFSDLEDSLPSSVRVSRINVRDVSQVGEQTRADLDLTVVGKTPTDVTGMIAEMNRRGTFSAIPVTETQKTGRGESGFEWLLRVDYVQRSRTRAEDSEGDVGAAADPATREGAGGAAGGRE